MNAPPHHHQGALFPMGSLYVGDLHPDVTEAMLYEKFSTAGQVLSLRICRDARTKQSLGYGYVNFNNAQDAERALDTMNFDCLKGKPMRIMWCQRDPSLRKSGVGNVFIKNLDKNIDNKAMYDTFSAFGNILSCKVALDDSGCSKGYGFVHFESEETAERAIEKVNGMLLNMKKVYVGRFVPRAERERQLGERARRFTNVFVKNFGGGVDEQRLRGEFARFGAITSAHVARDRDGSVRGFGFVAFAEAAAAERAVVEADGREVEGRVWYVGRAQKKAERANELRRRHEQLRLERFSKLQAVNVYVKNLDDGFDDERLRQEFGQFGSITSAKVMTENGRSRGFGFVCFSAPEEASKAIQDMNGKIVGTKPLYAALAQRREVRRALLNAQYAQRAAALRQHQQAALPFAAAAAAAAPPPFLLPAVQAAAAAAAAAAPARFFGHLAAGPPPPPAPALRPAPRWPQPALRPNGAFLPLPFRGGGGGQGGGGGGGGRAGQARARPITGGQQQQQQHYQQQQQQQPAARPNSKFTQHAAPQQQQQQGARGGVCAQAQQQPGNGGDTKEHRVGAAPAAPAAPAAAPPPPAEQKQLIGEQLFRIVEKLHPEMAGKITGMLLEIDNTELVHMIKDQESLRAKVEEAIAVLEAHKQQAAAAAAAAAGGAAGGADGGGAPAPPPPQGALVVQE